MRRGVFLRTRRGVAIRRSFPRDSHTTSAISIGICAPSHELRAGLTSGEKLKTLSFRGTPRAEESLLLLEFNPREIPHFVRNDNQRRFFRNLLSRTLGLFAGINLRHSSLESNCSLAYNNV